MCSTLIEAGSRIRTVDLGLSHLHKHRDQPCDSRRHRPRVEEVPDPWLLPDLLDEWGDHSIKVCTEASVQYLLGVWQPGEGHQERRNPRSGDWDLVIDRHHQEALGRKGLILVLTDPFDVELVGVLGVEVVYQVACVLFQLPWDRGQRTHAMYRLHPRGMQEPNPQPRLAAAPGPLQHDHTLTL
ncbi:MAG: hypothetical protein ACRD0K_00290 [Egibacteraceae bacterium]